MKEQIQELVKSYENKLIQMQSEFEKDSKQMSSLEFFTTERTQHESVNLYEQVIVDLKKLL